MKFRITYSTKASIKREETSFPELEQYLNPDPVQTVELDAPSREEVKKIFKSQFGTRYAMRSVTELTQ